MGTKTRFLDPAWRELAEQTLRESKNQIQEAATLLKDRNELNRSLLFAPVLPALSGSEDRIVERVTNNVVDALTVGNNTDRIAFRITGDALCRWPSSSTSMLLSPQRKRLIECLSHDFASPKTLAGISGFKDAVGVQQAVAKIKRKFQATFGLPEPFIEGKEGYGYRIAEAYHLMVDA